jgi:hypothetical protein
LCLLFASLAAALGLAAAARDECSAHAAVIMPMIMRSLSPWIAARRVLSSDETVAAFKATSSKRMPVIVYNGSVYFTKRPEQEALRGGDWTMWLFAVGELARIAAADPRLRLEFILNVEDDPAGTSASAGIPLWGFNRRKDFVDVAMPNYYAYPDGVCSDERHRTPWLQRRAAVIGRFAHFCSPRAPVSVHGDALRLCPRTYFTELTERMRNASGAVELDVATMNQLTEDTPAGIYRSSDNKTVKARPPVPLSDFSGSKYVCVTDGIVSAGKLSAALALGSVVLLPASSFSQYFEPALLPWVHYVPIWVDQRDDIIGAVAWLHAHPAAARRIAKAGRAFACRHLVLSGRTCWWKRMAQLYQDSLLGYKLDDAWFAARRDAFGDDMVQLTPDVLVCDAPTASQGRVNSPPRCVWKGPVTDSAAIRA